MHILFTGAGRRVELMQAFREAALILGKELKIYGADMSLTAPSLVFCDYVRRVVPMKDPSYIDNLLDICKKDTIDLVIPTIDTDLMVLSENKARFEEIGTKVMISEPDAIHVCRDKSLTSGFFVSCGLHAPIPVSNWKEYVFGYPAFIKPKDGSSSVDAYKVINEKELEIYANRIQGYVIQPFISGKEYTIDIFCDWDGKPLIIVPRERLQVRSGEVLQTRIDLDQIMIEEAKRLCERLKPCGAITVQLIRDESGIDWYIEINPRYGGGAPLSMKAGAKSAELILKLLDGEPVEYVTNIDNHAVYSRFDQSIVISTDKSEVQGIIFDLDDTLYGEKEYIKSGFNAVSDYLEGEYEDRLWKAFLDQRPAIDQLLKELGRESEREKVLEIYRNHYPNIKVYDGVKETLAFLRRQGIKVGIITDGRPVGQRNKIKALGLEVDDVIITDELGGPQFRKPCDIAFRIMQTKWKIPASSILYVADNIAKDFQAPKQLGMQSLWFNNPDGLYHSEAAKDSIQCISDVLRMLKLKRE